MTSDAERSDPEIDGSYDGDVEVITYCRIGERSSSTWFTLHERLDWDVTNYDDSWTE